MDIKLEILSSGHIKFRRGNKKYNDKVKEIISFITEEDEEIMRNLEEFFKGSEDVEVIIGGRYCG